MIRAVLDTNIIISALFWKGLPGTVFEHALDGRYLTLNTEALTNELRQVLSYPKFEQQIKRRGNDIETLVARYQTISISVVAGPIPANIVRDPKDAAVLACAVGGHADVIVSGDNDLLVLNAYEGIAILNAEQFLERLSQID